MEAGTSGFLSISDSDRSPLHSWERQMLGKIEGRRERGRLRMRWLDGITDSVDLNLSMERNPEVPASIRDEALFDCTKPS